MNFSQLFAQTRFKIRDLLLILLLFMLTAGCARTGVYHQVQSGQTLYRISKVYEVDEAYLARINGIPNPKQLRVGTRIYIPGANSIKYVPSTFSKQNSTTANTPRTSTPSQIKPPVKDQTPTIVHSRPKTVVTAPSGIKQSQKQPKVNLKLHWPLRGKILRAFGQRGVGGSNGLEISAQEGTKVSAAAAGKVIYSGDGVQGFGHLMILQHENDVFTVYGFNHTNHVKQGQYVSQGERIASSGRPPSGEAGRLHFEVRIGKLAVDPILYLP